MLSNEIRALEYENETLKEALQELKRRMEENKALKPRSCQYCKYYRQYYVKEDSGSYHAVYSGYCTSGVPIKKGGKKQPFPNDTCPYFEIGTFEMNYI